MAPSEPNYAAAAPSATPCAGTGVGDRDDTVRQSFHFEVWDGELVAVGESDRDADVAPRLRARRQVGVLQANLGKGVGAGHFDRIRVPAVAEQPLALGLAHPELLGQVGLGGWARGGRL